MPHKQRQVDTESPDQIDFQDPTHLRFSDLLRRMPNLVGSDAEVSGVIGAVRRNKLTLRSTHPNSSGQFNSIDCFVDNPGDIDFGFFGDFIGLGRVGQRVEVEGKIGKNRKYGLYHCSIAYYP